MLNKIIKFSLHNRLVVLTAAVLLLIAGTYTAMHTEVDVFPDLNAPTVVIMTEANGMAAEEVEQLVTFPVETSVNGATGVRRVRSSSTNGFSVVWVEFDWGTNIYLARQIVSEKLAIVSESLPDNVGKPTLGPQSSILGEVLIVGLTADSTSMLDLRTIADWTIRPRLLSTGGVAQVAVLGGDIKEYQIQVDPARLRHYNLTMDDILQATDNMNQNSNGGVLYEYGNEYILRGVVSTPNVNDLSKALVKNVNSIPVRLSDIATVEIGAKIPKLGTASERGKPAVLLTVTKQPNTSTLDLTEKLELSLKELQKNLPSDVKISTDIFRQSRFIENSIGNVQKSLFEGGIFVVIVLFIFLANVRTTFISLITLPISLLASILTLHYMGLSINTMSLGGMAIAIGSLVDDAIVDVENVYKRLRENRLKPESERLRTIEVVFNASKEVRMPILNSTLIIIVSFVPLFFLSGMEGRMLAPLGIAFIVALIASTVVALTLTPVLCSYLLNSKSTKKEMKESFVAVHLKGVYQKALTWVLNHKTVTLGSTISLFIVALICFFTLGHSFLPSFNEGSFTINVSSLPGISLEESNHIGQRAEALLLSIPEIKTVARKTGRAELDEHALGVNVSEIEAPFELEDRSRNEVIAEVRQKLSQISGANIEIGQPISHRIDAMLSGTRANIAIKLFGDDLNKMFSIGNQIKGSISGVEGLADLNVEQQIERPQLKITPKREMLAKHGISVPEFSEFITVALAGKVVSQVYEKGQSFDLTVKVQDDKRDEMAKINELMIDTQSGLKVPLSQVAEIRSTLGPNTINRENVKRKIVISANVTDRDLRSVVNDIQKQIESTIQLPEGYHIEYGGQFESEQAASRILTLTSFMSVIIILLLLYHEFKSLKESSIILLNLPLALIGGVFTLLFTTGEISIPAIIGFISLFGIATRNGMLLISHYKYLQREEGMDVYESIIQGSLDRLNPILMTALSSALALIPLALGGDLSGNEIQSPMAKVILGGLLTSTFLNGFIIPIVYLLMKKSQLSKMEK
ncbi:MAG: efflux RND transporter permease subunit [Bacteroides sp.]